MAATRPPEERAVTAPPPFPTPTVYPRVRFARGAKGKLYSYAAPAGMCRVGDVVAVEANWVSCEGTLATVVEVATKRPELPPGVTLKDVWRVIPPDQLPLFGWGS